MREREKERERGRDTGRGRSRLHSGNPVGDPILRHSTVELSGVPARGL